MPIAELRASDSSQVATCLVAPRRVTWALVDALHSWLKVIDVLSPYCNCQDTCRLGVEYLVDMDTLRHLINAPRHMKRPQRHR